MIKTFINKYKKELEDISSILKYLEDRPEVLDSLGIKDLISSEELFSQQGEWIKLCSKFKGEEKEFFKPFWVTIQRSGLDYYIDISNKEYPLIKTSYNYFDVPCYWEKQIIFDSMSFLMFSEDSDLEKHRMKKILEFYRRYMS